MWKDIIREIWKSKARFLSIFAIILMGVAFFAGLIATGPVMRETADQYFSENDLMDIQVQSTLGLADEDMEILNNMENATVEGKYAVDVMLEQEDYTAKLFGYNEDQEVNDYIVTEGRLPEESGEIALDANEAFTGTYEIGDTVSINENTGDNFVENFSQTEFEVVGFVQSPRYVQNGSRGNTTIGSGVLDGFGVIRNEDFNMDYFTEANIRFDQTSDVNVYSEEYEQFITDQVTQLEDQFDVRSEERYEEIQNEAQEQINQGREELSNAKEQLQEGEQELADSRSQLDQGWESYEQGQQELNEQEQNAQDEFASRQQDIDNVRSELETREQELNEAQSQLDNGQETLNQTVYELDLPALEQLVETGRLALEQGRNNLNQGQLAIDTGRLILDQARVETQEEIQTRREQVETGKSSIEEARNGLSVGQEQLDQAKERVLSAAEQGQSVEALMAELDSAQAELDNGFAEQEEAESQLNSTESTVQQNLDAVNSQLSTSRTELENVQAELAALRHEQESSESESQEDSNNSGVSDTQTEQTDGSSEDYQIENQSKTGNTGNQEGSQNSEASEVPTSEEENAGSETQRQDEEGQGGTSEQENSESQESIENQETDQDSEATEDQTDEENQQEVPEQSEDASPDYAGRISELENEAASLEEQISELESQSEELNQHLSEIAGQKETLAASRSELESSQEELTQNREQLETQAEGQNIQQIQEELANSQEELDQAGEELEVREEQLAAGESTLNEAEEAAQSAFQTAENRLTQAQTGVDTGFEALSQAQSRLNAGAAELDAGRDQIDAAREQLAAFQTALNEGRTALEEGMAQLNQGEQTLNEAQSTVDQELSNAQSQLNEGRQQLEEGESAYQEGLQTFEEETATAEEEITQAEEDLSQAEEDLSNLEEPTYIFNNQSDFAGISEFGQNADRIDAIATIFPVFFFLLAVLISLTTMTRMVDEQRNQIGTMKALGYSNGAVATKFYVYAFVATIVGGILGLLIGYWIFPSIIMDAYGSMYNLPSANTRWFWSYALISMFGALIATGLATYFSVRSLLKNNAATLLRPKSPKKGKRIFLERIPFIWKRMSFTQKVSARNLFRYKGRMFMTIFGVAGGTALLLTGFGLSDSISNVEPNQFGDLYQYDATVAKNTDATEDELQSLNETVQSSELVDNKVNMYQSSGTASNEETQLDISMMVPQDAQDFQDFVVLRDKDNEENIYELPSDGAIVTQKLAEMMGVEVGDEITVTDSSDNEYQIPVSGVVEHYVGHNIYMSQGAYEGVTGNEFENNTSLLKYSTDDVAAEEEENFGDMVSEESAAAGVFFQSDVEQSFQDSMGSLNVVTIVLIVSAGALAFVVLYNLTNINISERIRELSTIKVLGFYNIEVTKYVYRENIVLTIMGILAGYVLGFFMHQFVISTAEVNMMKFVSWMDFSSYIYAAILMMIFSLIVGIVMHFKLKNIDMVEALKTED